MEGGKLGVVKSDLGNFFCISRDELNDSWRKTRLQHNVVEEVVRGDGGWRGLPDHNVAHQCRGKRKISGDGCEVKRGNGINKTFKRTVLKSAIKKISTYKNYWTWLTS